MAKDITVSAEIRAIMEQAGRAITAEANEVFNEVGREGVQKLKNESPKRTGQYAKSWTKKTEKGNYRRPDKVTIYNRDHYQLTHLLENGHVIRNAKGTYGRTSPQKHIEPVEDWCADEIVDRLKRKI